MNRASSFPDHHQLAMLRCKMRMLWYVFIGEERSNNMFLTCVGTQTCWMGHRVAAWQERVPMATVDLPRDLPLRPLPATEALHNRFRRQCGISISPSIEGLVTSSIPVSSSLVAHTFHQKLDWTLAGLQAKAKTNGRSTPVPVDGAEDFYLTYTTCIAHSLSIISPVN